MRRAVAAAVREAGERPDARDGRNAEQPGCVSHSEGVPPATGPVEGPARQGDCVMHAGDTVIDFEAPDQSGHPVRLGDVLRHGPVVLYFYPKAMTPGCTKESCHFRDVRSEIEAAGGRVLGISADAVDRQRQFDERHSLGFPLLSDPYRRIAAAFGVKRPGPLFNRRTTFVIDTDMRLLDVVSSELNMSVHADRAIAALRAREERERSLTGTPQRHDASAGIEQPASAETPVSD